jgi:cell division protein FtsI (penicillin-binding protein 3)
LIDLRSNEVKNFAVDQFRSRLRVVYLLLGCAALGLVARSADLQLFDDGSLLKEGRARSTRVSELAAHRGNIYDRNGEPLAISTPVDTVVINPQELNQATDQIPKLAEAMNRETKWIEEKLSSNLDRNFVYLQRHMNPKDAAQVKALNIPGISLKREYRRYYPAGEVTGHILGFTNIDHVGREGLEMAYDRRLGGLKGSKLVIQDKQGHSVEDVESIAPVVPGQDLKTSIDLRIQYLAYRELKKAVQDRRAASGSAVVIDVNTGEILAMVNQPTYNPNDVQQRDPAGYRNRAALNLIEPGSIFKPFVAAAAISTDKFHADTIIDTSPGFLTVGVKTISDEHPLGAASLTRIMARSSNVGMSKMALQLSADQIWSTLNAFGFGRKTASGFPGEAAGMLNNPSIKSWSRISQASASYGYGLQVTPLQLAQAYAILGSGGIARPLTFERINVPVKGERVIDQSVAHEIVKLMLAVVDSPDGTGKKAKIDGYQVAGKTGTAKIAGVGGYSQARYVASFGGIVPASNPRFACVVVINDPRDGSYYAADVAAPVFAEIMSGTLRILSVPLDSVETVPESNIVQAEVVP